MYITCQNQVLLIKIGFCIILYHIFMFLTLNAVLLTYTKSLNQEKVEILH